MTVRLEMLRTIRRAPELLSTSTPLVEGFLLRQSSPEGGFVNRGGQADLYYTAFGLQCLYGISSKWNGRFDETLRRVTAYLTLFGNGTTLDLVHLCCLARSWAVLGDSHQLPASLRAEMLEELETYRAADGGYHPVKHSPHGTAYAAFLASGAIQDLSGQISEPDRLRTAINSLREPHGGFANEHLTRVAGPSTTNATAAAINVLKALNAAESPEIPEPERVISALLRCAHPQGGFKASDSAPIPDLLSTATALHGLGILGKNLSELRESCLDFVDTLWTNEGAFFGYWGDTHLDCEYLFYGLLALGHLAPELP